MRNALVAVCVGVVVVLAVLSNKAQPQKVVPQADYKNWVLYDEKPLTVTLSDPTVVRMDLFFGKQRIFVEDVKNPKSKYVMEFEYFNKVVLRSVAENPAVLEIFANGQWHRGVQGAVPNVYLADSNALFKENKMKGLRITLETDDGKVTETVVAP